MSDNHLSWLFARQRFGIHPGLERVRALLARLGDPQEAFQTVLVGGTNGKGSTAAVLASILQADGRRTGLFTSPHLTRFTERFQVNGQEVSSEIVEAALDHVRPHAEASGATFFEIVTALGALLFAQAGVDLAVMEVGLGGRLDSTNVLDPLLSVLTNVALDHTEILGHTLEAIAAEKAGILRAGRPAVTGVAAALLPPLRATGADLWALGQEIEMRTRSLGWQGAEVGVTLPQAAVSFHTPLLGAHGARNAALAAAAAVRLGVGQETIRAGAAAARWPGRLERLPWHGGSILLDGAHNPDGARALASTLRELALPPLPLIFGAAGDKDVDGVVEALRPHVSHAVLTQAALSPRAAAAADLAPLFTGLPVTLTRSPQEALNALSALGGPLALACGSLYLVGELRPLLLGEAGEERERWQ
ncbi:folylpolyglutamate synthase [Deinococcus radiopugnans]|uniref:tetrahydrofolate synthase n=1 Tax=Deinococcus radiopugnans TaxID=57497 RepID=A0A0A7KCU8_9DEIO|nr:folylpolyglutamate synthase/dihydrofolate synthase family protein [Deinococcus radiopugnans]AIZ43920.1 folylpolyglutamate synthase [Deinococcus radiopugnans]QLG09398.1 bifunctional folylpolyglutamate synthase/dihydrofolate synthase [Deinococcus sp. D7000]